MKLTFVTDEQSEWEALYIDNDKFEEGHSIRVKDMISLMQKYGFIKEVEYKTINNQKYDNEESYAEFYSGLNEYTEDDFQ